MRICSTSQTNYAPTFIVQPQLHPQSDSQPPHQYVHVYVPTISGTSDVYSKNEKEENKETKLQSHNKGLQPAKEHGLLMSLVNQYISAQNGNLYKALSIC